MRHNFEVPDFDALKGFSYSEDQLAILHRQPPSEADIYFQKLMQTSFRAVGQVSKANPLQDIKNILADDIPDELQADPFYTLWLCRINLWVV